jgi:hypothetical protein
MGRQVDDIESAQVSRPGEFGQRVFIGRLSDEDPVPGKQGGNGLNLRSGPREPRELFQTVGLAAEDTAHHRLVDSPPDRLHRSKYSF